MPTGLSGKIVFSSGKQGDYDIWSLDLDRNELRQLTGGKCWNDKPRWSPDGRWIVFTSNASGTPDIYRMQADGEGKAECLIHNKRWNDWPAYSPDGKSLGYVSNTGDNNDLWIAAADGSNPKRITTHEGDDTCFAWMPDGKSVLFSSAQPGNADIFRLELAGAKQQQLTTDHGMDIHPAPSPDGKLIAFVSNRPFDGTPPTAPKGARPGDPAGMPGDPAAHGAIERRDRDLDIWMMGIDGRHPVRVTESQGCDRCVAWSPDGRHLVYTASSHRDSAERLRIVDVSALVAAYHQGDEINIQRCASRMRTASLKMDRRALEAEIDAARHPWFFTKFLPDFLMRPMYGEGYFGSERYPDWIAAGKALTKVGNSKSTARVH